MIAYNSNMSDFRNNLKWLMGKQGFSQLSLSKQIGIAQSQVHNWLNNKSEPTMASIITLCKTFKCSAGWLIGVEEAK